MFAKLLFDDGSAMHFPSAQSAFSVAIYMCVVGWQWIDFSKINSYFFK